MLKIFGSNTVEASPFSLKSLCGGTKSSPPPLPLFYLQGLRHTRVTVSAQSGGRGGRQEAEVKPFIRGKFHLLCPNLFLWLGPVCLVLKSQS